MSEWTWKIIDDLGQIVTGKTPSTKCPEYWDGDIPFITPKDIQGTKHCEKTERYITNAGSLSAGKVMLGRDAVCVSCIGNIGYVAMTTQNSVTNQQINSIVVNDDHSNDYVYYLMKNLWGYFKTCESQGTSVPILSKSLFSQIPVFVPTIALQRKISAVLSVLDNKIELNHRLNDNLESMAQALYDYWFVQFDFPDENGKPYKSSGGKMVWNEQLKREIPEGWEVKQIREVADTCLGGTPVTNIREYWDGGNIPWISSGDLTSNPLLQVSDYITQKGLNNSAAKLMPKGTVVVSLVRYIRPSILGIDAAGNQSVVGIFANKILPTCFLYPYVKSEVPRLMGLRTGAQQPHINKEVIDSSFIVLPDNVSIMGQYQNRALGIYEKLLCVAKERESLTKQRDFLLPLLMNGQVQVKPLNYRLYPLLVA